MRLVSLRFCHHAPIQRFRKLPESTKLVSFNVVFSTFYSNSCWKTLLRPVFFLFFINVRVYFALSWAGLFDQQVNNEFWKSQCLKCPMQILWKWIYFPKKPLLPSRVREEPGGFYYQRHVWTLSQTPGVSLSGSISTFCWTYKELSHKGKFWPNFCTVPHNVFLLSMLLPSILSREIVMKGQMLTSLWPNRMLRYLFKDGFVSSTLSESKCKP